MTNIVDECHDIVERTQLQIARKESQIKHEFDRGRFSGCTHTAFRCHVSRLMEDWKELEIKMGIYLQLLNEARYDMIKLLENDKGKTESQIQDGMESPTEKRATRWYFIGGLCKKYTAVKSFVDLSF